MAKKQRFLSIGFSIEGVGELVSDFVFIGKQLKNFSQPLKKSNSLLRRAIDVNFKSEGTEFGEPWKPLSPVTLKQKSRLRFGQKQSLVRTGKMKRGFGSKLSTNNLEIFNPTSYFPFHQSNKPRKKLPRRIMLKIDEKRRNEILRQFTIFLNKTVSHFGN